MHRYPRKTFCKPKFRELPVAPGSYSTLLTFLLKEFPGRSGSAIVVPVLPAAPPAASGLVLLPEPG